MTGAAINFEALAVWLALAATAAALLAWQYRADHDKARGWQGASAISLELLAAGMAIGWALANGDGAFRVLFIAGVIGLAVAKATLLPGMVRAAREGRRGALAVGGFAAFGAYLTVYALGAMSGVEIDTTRAAAALAESAPIQALDTEIAAARERLANLAGYADAGRAASEQAAADRIAAQLAAARAELAGCPRNYKTNCINPARAKIAALESGTAGDYAARHAEYNGLQAHLVALENRRAELLTGGTATAGLSVGAGDRMLAWLTGLNEERARSLKWLLLVLVFDVLSAAIRMFSEMMHGEDHARQAVARFRALLGAGFDPERAAALVAGGGVTPVPMRTVEPDTAPARFVAAQQQERQPVDSPRDAPTPEHRAEWFGFVPPGHRAERAESPVVPRSTVRSTTDTGTTAAPTGTRREPAAADALAVRAAGCEYEEVRRLILAGTIRPRKRALMETCGKGAAWALSTLRQLANEGVIVLTDNGYELKKTLDILGES